MAYRMVTEFGFSKDIGPFSYAGLPESERQATRHPEAIAEAREIIKEIELECAELLLANRNALDRLTAQLLEHETVSGEAVDACLMSAILPDVTDSLRGRAGSGAVILRLLRQSAGAFAARLFMNC